MNDRELLHKYNVRTENNVESFEVEEESEKKQRFNIDKGLLLMKCHYFLDLAGTACVEPFAAIYAKQLGISATSAGFILSITPLLSVISRPLLGGLVDYFQVLKISVVSVAVLKALPYAMIPFIPEKPTTVLSSDSKFLCIGLCMFILSGDVRPIWQCLANQPFYCSIECSNCSISLLPSVHTEMATIAPSDSFPSCDSKPFNLSLSLSHSRNLTILTLSEQVKSFASLKAVCTLKCPCVGECCSYMNDITSSQYWLFLIMRIFACLVKAMTLLLADTVCYELLEEKIGNYGRQRLFGVIGWGIFSFVTGILMEMFPQNGNTNFSIGSYLLIALTIIDVFVVIRVPVKRVIPSRNIFKDTVTLFSFETVIFMIAYTVCGALESIHTSYLFWYLEDLGASKLLISLSILLSSLLSEVPCFYYAGLIIEKLGHSLCIVIVLLTFCFRHICYFLMNNPWLALPIGLCHGINFGLLYASMTSYAKVSSKPGAETTTQGLLGGFHVGLGFSIGSLASGYSYEKLGGRMPFLITGAVAGLSAAVMLIIYQTRKLRR